MRAGVRSAVGGSARHRDEQQRRVRGGAVERGQGAGGGDGGAGIPGTGDHREARDRSVLV